MSGCIYWSVSTRFDFWKFGYNCETPTESSQALSLTWLSYAFFHVFITGEYMSLPASQYSVLDAERIERIDENTFRCYVYRLKFFGFEVCPVLLVRVDEEPDGCCIQLLSCTVRWCVVSCFYHAWTAETVV